MLPVDFFGLMPYSVAYSASFLAHRLHQGFSLRCPCQQLYYQHRPPACLQQVTAHATVETEYGSLQARTVLPQVQCQLNSKHPSLHLHKGVQQNTSLPLMVATTPPACNIAGDTAAMVLSDRIALQHKQKDTCLLIAHLSPPLSHNSSVTCVVSAKASHTLDDIMHYVQHRR